MKKDSVVDVYVRTVFMETSENVKAWLKNNLEHAFLNNYMIHVGETDKLVTIQQYMHEENSRIVSVVPEGLREEQQNSFEDLMKDVNDFFLQLTKNGAIIDKIEHVRQDDGSIKVTFEGRKPTTKKEDQNG